MASRLAPLRSAVIAAAILAAGAAIALPATAFAAAPAAPHTVTVDSPSAVLSATPWETTGAVDQDGTPVALTDPAVANFVGWAYYDADGTFRMYNLDDTPKMHGDWSIDPNGEARTITAKDDTGAALFTRTVPLVTLTTEEFTYRVTPDANTPDVYYDIIHTPTDHPEPTTTTPSSILAATPWETTGAVDQDGTPVALTDPAVANFVGWAYYDADGTFRMYNLDDTPKMHGDWSIDPNGEARTITAKDDTGAALFTRTVPLVTLTTEEFTYRVTPDANTPDVYYDIIHTPTDHPEPTTAPVPTAPVPTATAPVEVTSASPSATTAPELAETGSAMPVALMSVGVAAAAAGAGALVVRRRRAQG
ncbi:DUF4822 domain-containing protein [Microbacterium sp. GXS0129]|uniref:DUF4822 domain-containing protein n=1 Tax=Microbacterium sp. GXS0129 TaxID=3377836 RepID=UPI00383B88F1